MKTPKRFIAGAICPSCKEVDKLVMWSEDNLPHRECMACGFTDTFDEKKEKTSMTPELSTRVTPQQPIKAKQEAKIIQFFPNPKLNKKPN